MERKDSLISTYEVPMNYHLTNWNSREDLTGNLGKVPTGAQEGLFVSTGKVNAGTLDAPIVPLEKPHLEHPERLQLEPLEAPTMKL